MSIDNWIWVPAGIRNNNSIGYRKYKSCPEMLRAERPTATAHQVLLAHGADALIDEQYFFESADDARWFWDSGYEERLYVESEHKSTAYDQMTLWIDNKQVATRGYDRLDRFDTDTDRLPTGELRCDDRYKAVDSYGDVEWARCTHRATLKVRITPARTEIATDESLKVTYTPLPAEAYEAHICASCYEVALQSAGTEGSPAQVEMLGELTASSESEHADL